MRLIDADWVLAALGVFNDRKHGDAHFFNGITSAEEIVEHAPTIALRDWTPCAEGMPIRPDGKDIKRDWYIVTLETGMVTLRAYEFDERSPFGYGFHEQNIIPVIAWQPLPAPYRADDTTGKVKDGEECKE